MSNLKLSFQIDWKVKAGVYMKSESKSRPESEGGSELSLGRWSVCTYKAGSYEPDRLRGWEAFRVEWVEDVKVKARVDMKSESGSRQERGRIR